MSKYIKFRCHATAFQIEIRRLRHDIEHHVRIATEAIQEAEQLRTELAVSREREARMRDALIVVRHHPAFDDGGPMAEMMDQVTGGQPAPLLEKIAEFAALAEGAQG